MGKKSIVAFSSFNHFRRYFFANFVIKSYQFKACLIRQKSYPCFFTWKFILCNIIIRITFVCVVIHPFLKMIGNVKCSVVVAAKFIVDYYQFGIHVVICKGEIVFCCMRLSNFLGTKGFHTHKNYLQN